LDEKIRSSCFDCPEHEADVPKDICAPKCEKRLGPVRKIGHPTLGTMDPVIKKRDKTTTDKLISDLNILDEMISSNMKLGNNPETGKTEMEKEPISEQKEPISEQKEDILNKKLSNTNQDELTEKICPGKNCTHAGVLQPIDQFQTKISKNVYETCNTCRSIENKSSNKSQKQKGEILTDEPEEKIEKNSIKEITVNFTDHPEIYKELLELAEEKLRKPENQVLWVLIKISEKGLKTFPECQG
jgi:hypothetical protein